MRVPAKHHLTPPRRRARALTTALAAVATLFGAVACGSGDPQATASAPARSPAPTRSPPAPVGGNGTVASAPCAIRAGSVCVTERAGGHTLQLTEGWMLTVRLGASGRVFSPPHQDGDTLQALGAPTHEGAEVVSVFRAVRTGTSQLRATERPLCRAGQACPQYLVLWTLTVRVSRRP